MGENTKIEWARHTMNFWIGCTEVSPACNNCYAREMMDRRYARARWGTGEDRVRTSQANWRLPYKWDRDAEAAGDKVTVFCLSLGDIWDNEVDPLWREAAFRVMDETPNLIYLLLSKRIGNAEKMCDPLRGKRTLPRNAALGATMVNQEEWDRDAWKLEQARDNLGALFSFASIEPMLGPMDVRAHMPNQVIVGGESGPNARPLHSAWVRSVEEQCSRAGKAFFFKQWGEHLPDDQMSPALPYGSMLGKHPAGRFPDQMAYWRVGKKAAGRFLDGIEHNGFPEVPA